MTEIVFQCEKCGSCCKAVKCELLTKENKCPIYITRPEICNVEKGYEQVKYAMSKMSWYRLNKKCCSLLQNKRGYI